MALLIDRAGTRRQRYVSHVPRALHDWIRLWLGLWCRLLDERRRFHIRYMRWFKQVRLGRHDTETTADVQRQRADPRSALSLYRALLRLRRSEPALSLGAYITVRHNDAVLVYERRYEGRWLQIMLNMTGQLQPMPIEEPIDKIVLSTWLDGAACRGALELRPNEGLILEVKR